MGIILRSTSCVSQNLFIPPLYIVILNFLPFHFDTLKPHKIKLVKLKK